MAHPLLVTDIMKTSHDMWLKGWAEGNAGNISVRLDPTDLQHFPLDRSGAWVPLVEAVPGVAGDVFLVTATGRYLRNIELAPEQNVGLIELDAHGAAYRTIWGYRPTGAPTSELPSHMKVQAVRKTVSAGADRVVVHTHAPSLIALTSAMELDTVRLTQLLWRTHAECVIVFPDGVEFVPWTMPGTARLGEATARAIRNRRAVVWQFHGVLAVGRTLDAAFGLIDTIEKAASICLKVMMVGGAKTQLSVPQLRELAAQFNVTPDPAIMGA
jgi:rhamnulose-1-phosphate aldolase